MVFSHSSTQPPLLCAIYFVLGTERFLQWTRILFLFTVHSSTQYKGFIFVSNAEKISRDTKHTDCADQSVLIFLGPMLSLGVFTLLRQFYANHSFFNIFLGANLSVAKSTSVLTSIFFGMSCLFYFLVFVWQILLRFQNFKQENHIHNHVQILHH